MAEVVLDAGHRLFGKDPGNGFGHPLKLHRYVCVGELYMNVPKGWLDYSWSSLAVDLELGKLEITILQKKLDGPQVALLGLVDDGSNNLVPIRVEVVVVDDKETGLVPLQRKT